jgi:hypothetical protein
MWGSLVTVSAAIVCLGGIGWLLHAAWLAGRIAEAKAQKARMDEYDTDEHVSRGIGAW